MAFVEGEDTICPTCEGPKNPESQTCSRLCGRRLRTRVAGRQCKPETLLKIVRVLDKSPGPISARGLREGLHDYMGGYTPDVVSISRIAKIMFNPIFIDIIEPTGGSGVRTFQLIGGSGLKDWMRPDLYAKMMSLEAESFSAECVSCATPEGHWRDWPLCSQSGKSLCVSCCDCNDCRDKWNQLEKAEIGVNSFSAEDQEPTEAEITEAMISRIGRGGPIGLNQGAYDAESFAAKVVINRREGDSCVDCGIQRSKGETGDDSYQKAVKEGWLIVDEQDHYCPRCVPKEPKESRVCDICAEYRDHSKKECTRFILQDPDESDYGYLYWQCDIGYWDDHGIFFKDPNYEAESERSFSADDSKQGLIIPADGDPVSVEITGLDDMQTAVDGYIERVAGGDDWDLWGNEEGIMLDLPINESARVVAAWAHDTERDNIIPLHGDFLVLGIDQTDGESKDLPENIRNQIGDLLQLRGLLRPEGSDLPPVCVGCGEPTSTEGYCKEDEKICQGCCNHESCTFFGTKAAHTDTVQCKCGAQLQWDEVRKAWYCIECPFNTYLTKKDAEYTRISGGDMDTFLTDHGFEEINHPRAHERVYDKLYGRGPEGGELVVRIYTSIVKDEARDLGKDAIRVVPLYLHPTLGEFPMSRQKRVHRVLGWRNNLENRIETAEASAPGPVLDSNGKPMRLRRNRKSGDYFWGSIDYPANTETKSYRGA